MGDKNIRFQGTLFKIPGDKPVSQGLYARTKIHNDKPFTGPDFQAGGISPKDNSIRTGTGNGPPDSPKTD
jgi:hypothetical protein